MTDFTDKDDDLDVHLSVLYDIRYYFAEFV